MRVLICGGGVIGASVAYFLSRRGAAPVVIERTQVAGAASGKSGGFLALDWCDGSALAPLARRSFALHAALADGLGGGWGYRRLATYSVLHRREAAAAAPSRGWPTVSPSTAASARRRRRLRSTPPPSPPP
jgi:glycine/D-amino acid oxidase-like deaminating enzyme